MLFFRILLVFILFSISLNAWCCSCHSDIEEMNIAKYNEAEAIFIGEVDSTGPCTDTKNIYFHVRRTMKGNLPSVILIEEILCKSSCALNFEDHREYLVYLYKDQSGKLKIYPCTGTRKILNKQEISNELLLAEKFNTLNYIKKELDLWSHEIEFLEKASIMKEGNIKTYYSNGALTGEGKYHNGVPVGNWKYFYPDGNIKSEGTYHNGEKSGHWIEYTTYYSTYEDTLGHERKKFLVKNYGSYENGFKEGKWERVNLDGSIQKFFYKKGKFISDKEQ